MKISTILVAVVFSAAATVWSAGHEAPPAEPVAAANAVEPRFEPAEAAPRSDAIRQFVWDLRWEAIGRWFDRWDAAEEFHLDPPDGDDWWEDALATPELDAVVGAEAPGVAVGAAASGRGTAVSMAVVDGHYEIEAAWSGEDGPQRYRARGTRDEVERWAAGLPRPLRRAVRRQLDSTDLDGPAW